MKVDDTVVVDHQNSNVVELETVTIWAAPGTPFTPADAKIRNLEYKSGEKVERFILYNG